jgi:hypothetical protein
MVLPISINSDNPLIIKWIKDFWESDIGYTIIELSCESSKDFMIYGYNPWNYPKEVELNLKHQGYIK